jgi:hypothetical protein
MNKKIWIVAGLMGLLGICCVPFPANAAEPDTRSRHTPPVGSNLPKIHFETNFFDFGKVAPAEMVAGVFTFKNAGTGLLKVEAPQPGCDCTTAEVKPDTLAPGESGVILYHVKLDRALKGQRFIRVRSNDPRDPIVELTVQLDYTPLYEVSPRQLWLTLPPERNEVQASFLVTRADDKPLAIDHLAASEPWLSAEFSPPPRPEDKSARIRVSMQRPPGPPAAINASIQLWNTNVSPRPVLTLPVAGEVLGELAASPRQLYWVIPDFGNQKTNYPPEALTRTIELRSLLGHDVEVKKAASDLKGLSVQVIPKEPGRRFDLIVRFEELPREFANGKVVVETSLPSLPKLEVPLTIAVAAGK